MARRIRVRRRRYAICLAVRRVPTAIYLTALRDFGISLAGHNARHYKCHSSQQKCDRNELFHLFLHQKRRTFGRRDPCPPNYYGTLLATTGPFSIR
jgi:hypothetical protein